MKFLRDLITESMKKNQSRFWSFFDKSGKEFSRGKRTANYLDYYYAIGEFGSKESQKKYQKLVRLVYGMELLLFSAFLVSIVSLLISLLLAWVIGGLLWEQLWENKVIFLLTMITVFSNFSCMLFGLFIEGTVSTKMLNAYEKEVVSRDLAIHSGKLGKNINLYSLIGFSLLILYGFILGRPLLIFLLFLVCLLVNLVLGFMIQFLFAMLKKPFSKKS